MPKRSLFTEAYLEVAEVLRTSRLDAAKSTTIPVGMQKATAEQMRREVRRSRSAREAMLKEPGGQKRLLKLLAGGR